MRRPIDNAELLTLLEAVGNDQLTDEQLSRLQELLRNDREAQRMYLTYIDLHLGLRHLAGGETLPRSSPVTLPAAAEPSAKSTGRGRPGSLVAAIAVAAAVILVFAYLRTQPEPSRSAAPSLTLVEGSAVFVDAQGNQRPALLNAVSVHGERLETIGQGSLAELTYGDGTRLALVHDTSLTALADQRKRIVLHHGIVSAEVAAQPTGRPMQVDTPELAIEVIGTRFAVAATDDRTELKVAEGSVRLTSVSDGRTLDVGQGQGVVANRESAVEVRPSSEPPKRWQADFETGPSSGWTGQWVQADLPADSQGAIRAIREDIHDPPVYVLALRDAWVEGLFAIEENSHLHVTLKMERPDWLNVFMSSRTNDETSPRWALHNFNEVPYWPPKPGQWSTITIPLKEFRTKRSGVFQPESPSAGDVVYALSISAPEPDRGLVVDRIWVTPEGSGKVEARPLGEELP